MSDEHPRDGWVYVSDASWASKGNRSGTRYHCPRPADPALSACGYFMLDLEYGGQPAEMVTQRIRCRRSACVTRWPS